MLSLPTATADRRPDIVAETADWVPTQISFLEKPISMAALISTILEVIAVQGATPPTPPLRAAS